MVLFRLLRAVRRRLWCHVGRRPVARLLYAAERAQGEVDWGMGVMSGPDHGPLARAWLTETYS